MAAWELAVLAAVGFLYGFAIPWLAERLTRRGGAHEHP